MNEALSIKYIWALDKNLDNIYKPLDLACHIERSVAISLIAGDSFASGGATKKLNCPVSFSLSSAYCGVVSLAMTEMSELSSELQNTLVTRQPVDRVIGRSGTIFQAAGEPQ